MQRILFWLIVSVMVSACAVQTLAANETLEPLPTHMDVATPTELPPTPLPTQVWPTLTPTAFATSQPTPTLSPSATTTPLPTLDAEASKRRVRLPILMYHYVEPWPADASNIRKSLTVRPEDFAAQMAYLHDQGYVTVSLYELMTALTVGTPLPEKAVILTFDDGYRSLMDYAVPEMNPYGYAGTVFVITELMDREFDAYLTWPQAEALYAQGWKIEPHTKTHDELAGEDRDFQLYQMLGSMQTVEAHIGVMPRFFCYPAGKYDDVTLRLAHELNLWGAVTTTLSRWHTLADQYTLSRVRIDGQGTLENFITSLEGDLQP
jgi:peptidoglycan/xylan/chitin deacetylase (PgdA/CDA1 family)